LEEIYLNVHSRYCFKDTLDILRNAYSSTRINMYDLDGTIHRGRNPKKYNGYSSVDFSIALGKKLMLNLPHKVLEYASACLDTRKLKNDLEKIGLNKEDRDYAMVEVFFKGALQGLPQDLVSSSTKKLPKLAYKKAKETILELSQYATTSAILTKAFSSCAEPYVKWFQNNGLEMLLESHDFEVDENGIIENLKQSLTLSKEEQVNRVLQLNEYNEALVFGDHDRDLEMTNALDKKEFDYKLIAVNPFPGESNQLTSKADLILNGWEGIYNFLKLR